MSTTLPEPEILRKAVALACRAPSLHNSQPWRWVVDAAALHLYADPARGVHAADSSGREMILSCGAVLDHLRVALAAAGWNAAPHRLPDPAEPDHLATCVCGPLPAVGDADRERAEAIDRRRTDRLPFAAPRGWEKLEATLRRLAERDDVMFDVVSDDARPQLAEASRLTEALRRQDPTYQSELRWWTSPFERPDQGVPQTSRVSSSEASRVDVARAFPTTGYGERRTQIGEDRSKIVVLSTRADTRLEVLRCGETLSTILLECTTAGMATCTLTHMTEVAPSRDLVSQLIGRGGMPQLLIRIGKTPTSAEHLPPTPRRPLTEVLEFV